MKIFMLGAGSMGEALIEGLAKAKNVSREKIFVLSGHAESTQRIAQKYQINAVEQIGDFAEADLVINATPVSVSRTILPELGKIMSANATLISVAYGIDIAELKSLTGRTERIVYMIPNIPVSVNKGVLAVTTTPDVAEDAPVFTILHELGEVIEAKGKLMDVVSAGAGSAPAYAAMFVEALADGMVLHGLGRKDAYKVAEQMLLGTAELLLEEGQLPAALKDQVASPGGSTIRGVNALEQAGFRAAVISAITKTIA